MDQDTMYIMQSLWEMIKRCLQTCPARRLKSIYEIPWNETNRVEFSAR